MRTRYLYMLRVSLALSDLLLVNLCYWLCYEFVDTFRKELPAGFYMQFSIVFNLSWLLSAGVFGLHLDNTMRKLELIYRGTWRALLSHGMLVGAYIIFTKDSLLSRQFIFFLFSSLSIAMLLSRFFITLLDVKYRRSVKTRRQVAVLGFNPTGIKLAHYFESHPNDYRFSGILDETESRFGLISDADDMHELMRQSIKVAAEKDIAEVYAAIPPDLMPSARPLMHEAELQCVRLKLVPDLSSAMASRFQVSYMEEFPVLSLRTEPLEDMNNRFKKRLFDIFFASLVIIFVLSWLYPLLAIIIKIQSPGPVLFKQKRSGRDNLPFTCFKFRSMKVNNDSDKKQATANDDRITPIGRILRKSSLDEMPQFFNVLKGEMSVVGPRPHMLSHTAQYSAIIDGFMVRHFLKPGITGWAQVTGYRGETKDPSLMAKRVEKDIYYLENWSLMFDVKIIFLTVFMTIKGDDKAY